MEKKQHPSVFFTHRRDVTRLLHIYIARLLDLVIEYSVKNDAEGFKHAPRRTFFHHRVIFYYIRLKLTFRNNLERDFIFLFFLPLAKRLKTRLAIPENEATVNSWRCVPERERKNRKKSDEVKDNLEIM